MNIKIRLEDKIFSQWIRKRDRKCVCCFSPVSFNQKGDPVTHQASHFWTRRNEATRFDPENVDTLCFSCHQRWGGDYRSDYEEFKLQQLGKKAFDKLMVRAHSYYKKDRKLALVYVKSLK